MLPEITIITAIKNGIPLFRETVNAVLAQTDSAWNWIIVDDGSTEPIQTAIPQLADRRITVIRLSDSQRQTKALNIAIERSKTDIVIRMDGDDLPREDWLASHRQAWSRSPTSWVIFSEYVFIDEQGKYLGTVRYRPLSSDFFSYLEKKNNPICHPTVSFRAKTKGELQYSYSEAVSNAQDYELWRRILRERGASSFLLIEQPLVSYRIATESLSGAANREQTFELASIRRDRPAGTRITEATSEEKARMQGFRLLVSRYLSEDSHPLTRTDICSALDSLHFKGRRAILVAYILLTWPLKSLAKRLIWKSIYR